MRLFIVILPLFSCLSKIYAQSCQTPSYFSITNIQSNSALANWSAYGPATIQVAWREAGMTDWPNSFTTTTSGYASLTGLTPDVVYEARILNLCTGGDISAAITQIFRTSCPVPNSPTTQSVQFNAAILNWWYDFLQTPKEIWWRPANTTIWNTAGGLVNPPYSLTGLANNTTYEWKIRGVCSVSAVSDFTTSQLFRTQCQTPLSLNTSSIYIDRAQLYWYSNSSNPTYELQWRPVSSTITAWNSLTTTSAGWQLTGLTNNTDYQWRVRVLCSATEQSDFTATQTFRTRCDPPTAWYVSTRATSAQFSWYGGAGTSVTLQYRPANNPNWTTVSDLISPPYTASGLSVSTTYNWQIQAVCGTTEQSAFAVGNAFQTQCVAVSNGATTVGSTAASLSWITDEPTAQYTLRWRNQAASDWTTVSGLTTSPYTLTGLTTGATYSWQIQRVCLTNSGTVTTGFSTTSSFQPTCQTPSSLYGSGNGFGGANLNWYLPISGSFDSRQIDLQWRPRGGTDWSSTVLSGSSTSATIFGLTPGVPYEWRVRSLCGPNMSSNYVYSLYDVVSFCSAPYQPSIQMLGPDAVQVSVYSAGNAIELQWRVIGDVNWQIEPLTTSGSIVLEKLPMGRNFECRIRIQCSPGVFSDFSYLSYFSTQCNALYSLNFQGVTPTTAQVSWWPYPNYVPITSYEIQWKPTGTTDWASVSTVFNPPFSLTGLTNNTSYDWRIRQFCTPTFSSSFTNGVSFQTGCHPPTLNYPQVNGVWASLSWQPTGTDETRYTLDWRPATTSTWTSITGLTATGYTFPNLAANTLFYWRVSVACSSSLAQTATSSIGSFQTNCSYISSLYAEQPSATSVWLRWQSYNQPASNDWILELNYRPSGTTNWTVVSGLAGSAYLLTNLLPDTNYEWRIGVVCSPNTTANFSWIYSFQIGCKPPKSLYVSQTSSPLITVLNWQEANTYYYNNTFLAHTFDLSWRPANTTNWTSVTGLKTATYSLTGLPPNTVIEWQVRTLCSNGKYTDYTTSTFTTPKNCPTLYTSSAVAQNETTMSLYWSSYDVGSLGAKYFLQWRPTSPASASVAAWQSLTVVGTAAYSLTGLQPNTSYEWRVQTFCNDTQTLATSGIATFQTRCQKPNQWSSAVISGVNIARFTVSFAPGQNRPIKLQWRILGTTDWQSLSPTISDIYTLTGLAANTAYEAQIAAVCSANDISDFIAFQFQTGCKSINKTWTETTNTTAKLYWDTLPDDRYQVQWRLYDSTDWNLITDIASTSAILSGLLPSNLYEWRVRVICPAGEVGFTATKVFRTLCSGPTWPNWSVAGSASANLYWTNPLSETSNTEIQWRQQGSLGWQSAQTDISGYLLNDLAPGVTYEWRVRHICTPSETSDFVKGQNIVLSCPYSNPIISQKTPGQVQVLWQGYQGVTYRVRWRAFGTATWLSSPPISATNTASLTYQPIGLTPNYLYEIVILPDCSSSSSSVIILTLPDCSELYTVRDGSWAEPSVWSCGRLPTTADAVRLNHVIVIPAQFKAEALQINDSLGSRLQFNLGAGLRVGR
jgi:trimeric autotransporter adhesin